MGKKCTFLFFASFLYCISFAQTIINYQSWSGTSSCNAFGSGLNVQGTVNGVNTDFLHQSAIGQPMYNSVDKAVMLECKTENNGSIVKGTTYRINYTFKANYIYKLTINAACVGGNTARLRLFQDNGGGTTNSCSGSAVIDANASGGGYVSKVITSGTTWADYAFDLPVYATQWGSLSLSAIPSASANLQFINIRKITITETPPAPDFKVNSINITCGSTAPQTFTVTNLYNSPGVTSYTWDLGTNNGWLYNGTAAPQYISTTANTLTLTPNSAVQNIAVTVQMNQQDYKTYTGVVNMTVPAYSIEGPDNICSSETYQIPGLIANSTVQWSTIPTGIVSVPATGNPVSVSNLTDGSVKLIATISSACTASPVVIQKVVYAGPKPINIAGPYDPVQHTVMGVTCLGKQYYYVATDPVMPDPAETYTWTLFPPPNANTFPSLYTGSTVYLTYQDLGYYTLRVAKSNACGSTSTDFVFNVQECYFEFKISTFPNPVQNTINVSLENESEGVKKLDNNGNTIIELYSINSMTKQKQWIFKNSQKKFSLNVAGLRKGVNILRITKGKYQQTIKVILQ